MSAATLLHSSVPRPSVVSGLCSIRFSVPVRVFNIRIHDDDRTQPEQFVLDVYLSCQLVPTPAEPKPKPTNALVPTRIVHPGSGTRDLFVNMTPEYTTKLTIIKGDVTSLHVSVYGTVHAPGSTDPAPYSALDPVQAPSPLTLGQDLLNMTSEPPALPMVVKFACRRLAHEDQVLVLSQLLYNAACQSSSCAEISTNIWDPAVISACFTASMAKPILQNLLMAAATRDVALYPRKSGILKTDLQTSSGFAFFVPWAARTLSHGAPLGIFILSMLSAPSVLDIFSDLPHTTRASDALGNTDLRALGHALVGLGAVLGAVIGRRGGPGRGGAHPRRATLLPGAPGRLRRARSPRATAPRLFGMVDALLPGEHPALDAEAVLLALMANPRCALRPHV
ncbi:hypothetical protein AURDEDRAFT_113445 [Auricularia subglabra TFB-10046 SS5]|nr:hypothetical protein AURDEDRAFT_113445 [Auricularia subglabra TFB-10046 SS5]